MRLIERYHDGQGSYSAFVASVALITLFAAAGVAWAGCLDDKLEALRGHSTPFSTTGGVRSGSCGGCCAFGTCQPPRRRETVRYNAPPGYTIEGAATVHVDSANGEGGVGPAAYATGADGQITGVSVELWSSSQNQAAGAGAWRSITLSGTLRRHVTPEDVIAAAKQCGAR